MVIWLQTNNPPNKQTELWANIGAYGSRLDCARGGISPGGQGAGRTCCRLISSGDRCEYVAYLHLRPSVCVVKIHILRKMNFFVQNKPVVALPRIGQGSPGTQRLLLGTAGGQPQQGSRLGAAKHGPCMSLVQLRSRQEGRKIVETRA